MTKCYKYEKEDGTITMILELWASSTKHPDSRFDFSDFKTVDYLNKEVQIFQWILECASKLTMPFYAENLVRYAMDNWRVWEKDCVNHNFTLDK